MTINGHVDFAGDLSDLLLYIIPTDYKGGWHDKDDKSKSLDQS